MSNIIWRKSSELIDLKTLLAHRQDFTLYGTLERISVDEKSVKIKLYDKDREWVAVWFDIIDNFDLEPLKETEFPLLELNAKIETFFGKDGLLRTKITLTQWREADGYPESTTLELTDLTLISNLATDQKGLSVLGFERQVEVGFPEVKTITEKYHIRWYNTKEALLPSTRANIKFRLKMTYHQINADGIRVYGTQPYEYERDGTTVTGERKVYWICLDIESIEWK